VPAPTVQIVAWGNSGRSDDGVGLALASELARIYADEPRVRISRQHQLGPEMVEQLEACRRAVFLDAHVDERDAVRVQRVEPQEEAAMVSTHHCPPEVLLSLGAALGMVMPECYLVSVRARDLSLGDQLSEATARDMASARREVEKLVRNALA
jgi:hydrogenase maturation protease